MVHDVQGPLCAADPYPRLDALVARVVSEEVRCDIAVAVDTGVHSRSDSGEVGGVRWDERRSHAHRRAGPICSEPGAPYGKTGSSRPTRFSSV